MRDDLTVLTRCAGKFRSKQERVIGSFPSVPPRSLLSFPLPRSLDCRQRTSPGLIYFDRPIWIPPLRDRGLLRFRPPAYLIRRDFNINKMFMNERVRLVASWFGIERNMDNGTSFREHRRSLAPHIRNDFTGRCGAREACGLPSPGLHSIDIVAAGCVIAHGLGQTSLHWVRCWRRCTFGTCCDGIARANRAAEASGVGTCAHRVFRS